MNYDELGTKPISEENPAGIDVKYDEEFELIESEMVKLSSPSASNGIDWEKVAKFSSTILESKSKNILVAVYLSYALFKLRNIDGLVDGVKVIADILENYWETLYPPKKRLKGRINAINWWLDKITKDLESMEITQVDSDKKENLTVNLKRIDDFLNDTLEDAPLFYNLINLLDAKLVLNASNVEEENVPKDVKGEEKQEEKQEEKVEVKKQEIKQETPTLSSDVENDFKTTANKLNVLIGQMIQTKDYRAELFMLNRAFIYLDIDELPASEKNITMLPPPDSQEVELLNSLYKEKKYEALLFSAESRITSYFFWLDLHYYVAESLKNLEQEKASSVVYEQTQYFIQKLPNIQNLCFSDSTPFASKDTKKWLKQKNSNKESSPVLQVQKKEISDAPIDILNEKMNSCNSVEEEVLYNIKICESLEHNPNETLIYTYLEKLLDTIKKYETIKWSPSIALKAYQVGVECLKVLDNSADNELLNSLLKKIALLKPSLID